MARTTEKLLAASGVDFLYQHQGEVPWREIEAVAGKQFTPDERAEIYECSDKYSWEHDWIDGGASKAHTIKLRDSLSKKANSLASEINRVSPSETKSIFDESELDVEDTRSISALNILCTDDEFHLRQELRELRMKASTLAEKLSRANFESLSSSRSNPKVSGLAAFISAVLKGAVAVQARSKMDGANEYFRWGIQIGPEVDSFRRLAEVILKRGISRDQLDYAFENARSRMGDGG